MAAPAESSAPHPPRVAVVIPALQAAATVGAVVARVRAALPGASVIVVDDGSSDGTGEAGRGAGATVLVHPRNWGKGTALATGVSHALEEGADLCATLDADAQHPPEELPRLLAPLRDGSADLVLGARTRSAPMPPSRRCSNWLSSRLASRIAGRPVADSQTGFRAFTRDVAAVVRPAETRYDYETAFLLSALARGFRVTSVAVPTVYDGAPSHFRPVVDTWRLARVFARYARSILFGAA
jgi:glycosyltransferase involved in cell wall biosynthesis